MIVYDLLSNATITITPLESGGVGEIPPVAGGEGRTTQASPAIGQQDWNSATGVLSRRPMT